MRRQGWRKWIMATAMAGILVGQNGFGAVQAAEMPETQEDMEVDSLAEEAPEEGIVQSSGLTYTVDGDTVTITGEGTLTDTVWGYDFWDAILPKAKHVKFENCKIIGGMESFFSTKEESAFAVESVDLSGLDTSGVTSMSEMFRNCTHLISVDMRGIDTSNVTDMWCMFAECSSLRDLDVSELDTSNVISMDCMFDGCSSLMHLNVSGFDTSNVMNMTFMFRDCNSLLDLDVSGFDTSNVVNMYGMFSGCSQLKNLDVSGINTGNVTNMEGMFRDCNSLLDLDVSDFDTSNVVNMDGMFSGCSQLKNLDVSGINTGNVTNMKGMFRDCRSLVSIDLSSFDLTNVYWYSIGILQYIGTEDMLSGTNLQRLKTPHALGGKYIDLPDTFVTSDGRETNRVTKEFCNMTLIRKGADVPTIPDVTPVPVPTPAPTPAPTPVPTPGPEVSEEAKANVNNFVSRMYTVALNRASEPAGQEYWANRLLIHDTDGAGIAHGFIMSGEFEKRNLTDWEYVDVLYRTFFNREEAPEERAYWLARLKAGNSRGYVLSGFVNSREFDELCDSYGIIRGKMKEDGIPYNAGIRPFVERQYTKVLNRAGEKEGMEYWTEEIVSGRQTPEDVAKRFFQSDEFIKRGLSDSDYVEVLYETFLDRPSEPDGKAYWLKKIGDGMDRGEVLEGFSKSPEFAGIVAGYGL